MNKQSYELGTIEASEQLVHDLYIDLRKKANHWASITHQTAQARMGYVEQPYPFDGVDMLPVTAFL